MAIENALSTRQEWCDDRLNPPPHSGRPAPKLRFPKSGRCRVTEIRSQIKGGFRTIRFRARILESGRQSMD